jgi:hypothetical protein
MLGSPRRFNLPSRLGDPAPQPKTGAARFASPVHERKDEQVALKRQNVKASKREKLPMTIRLTPTAIDKLSEIERSMRRVGIRARQASASEIVEALIEGADPVSLAEVFKSGKR